MSRENNDRFASGNTSFASSNTRLQGQQGGFSQGQGQQGGISQGQGQQGGFSQGQGQQGGFSQGQGQQGGFSQGQGQQGGFSQGQGQQGGFSQGQGQQGGYSQGQGQQGGFSQGQGQQGGFSQGQGQQGGFSQGQGQQGGFSQGQVSGIPQGQGQQGGFSQGHFQQTTITSEISSNGISNQTSSHIEAREGEYNADISAYLRYASELNNSIVISGSSEYSKIASLKDAILELKSNYFNPNNGLSVQGEARDELDRRFLLIEHELDGLLRRRIQYSTKDQQGGERYIDFTQLLNEKETKIIELEKRIQNLEGRLGKTQAGEGQNGDYEQGQKDLETLRANFAAAASLWNNQFVQLKSKYPNDQFDFTLELNTLLQ
jgi:hypothetical protein